MKSFREVALAMPPSAVDSLYVASLASGDTAFVRGLEADLMQVPKILRGSTIWNTAWTSALVEDLSDQELKEVLAVLSSTHQLGGEHCIMRIGMMTALAARG